MQENFSVINKSKSKLPRLPFLNIKNNILGKNYSLSIAFVSPQKAKEINKKYRKKNKPTNVLSFSLYKNEGELVLCPSVIKNEVKNKKFDKTFKELVLFLVIHGMLHLKGLAHSSKMNRAEKKYYKKYDKKYFNRNRYRIHDDQSRSGRIHQRRKKS